MDQKRSFIDTLDPTAYNLAANPDALAFYERTTGLQGDQLREHVLDLQGKAYQVFPYPCIGGLRFLRPKISSNPVYPLVLEQGVSQRDAIFLDLGCCFGVDPRKAVYDGFATDQVLGSDLRQEFMDLGYDLFRDRERCGIKFIPGDIFDPKFFDISNATEPRASSTLSLAEMSDSLQPLSRSIAFIHAGSLFHLFDESTQFALAERLAHALSPRPGATIFGAHGGMPQKGFRPRLSDTSAGSGNGMFCHSPDSWKDMWKEVWEKHGSEKLGGNWEDLELKAELQEVEAFSSKRALLQEKLQQSSGSEQPRTWYQLVWSVRRR